MPPQSLTAPGSQLRLPLPPTPRATLTRPQLAVLAVIMLGSFITSLNSSVVTVGLPSIARAFEVSLGGKVEWVIIAYLVVDAALLLTVGRLTDLVGRVPLWMSGLILFAIGSALCGAAPSLDVLVAARAFQGIGGALIYATGLVILVDTFSSNERGRVLGMVALASAVSSCLGPTLGGLISEHLEWRWLFFVNVPVALGAAVASRIVLPRGGAKAWQRFDLVGAILFGVAVVGMTLAPSLGQQSGWTSLQFLGTISVIVIALICAVKVERRAPIPLIDLSFFSNRYFDSAMLRLLLSRLALIAVSLILPFYFEQLRGFPPHVSGLLLTPLPVSIMIFGPIAGWLADRFPCRWLESLSLAIVALSLVFLARLGPTSSLQEIATLLILVGIGQGLFSAPNGKSILDAAPESERGQASGLLSTGHVVGQSLSIAFASAIFAGFGSGAAGALLHRHGASLNAHQLGDAQVVFLDGFRVALLVCAAFAVLGVLTTLIPRPSKSPLAKPPRNSQPVKSPSLTTASGSTR
jgi:EmrB/QacA subfamily drug resistance transporter